MYKYIHVCACVYLIRIFVFSLEAAVATFSVVSCEFFLHHCLPTILLIFLSFYFSFSPPPSPPPPPPLSFPHTCTSLLSS